MSDDTHDGPRLRMIEADTGYRDHAVSRTLSLDIPDGAFTVILGPNACGKSTLLRTLSRLQPALAGEVVLDGEAIARLPSRAVARTLGLLPQTSTAPEGITVADLIARGRHPHQRIWRQWSRADETAVAEAMELTGVGPLAGRFVDELSGGQRQRVWIALVLAQQTPYVLLDEPTTYLDVAYQVEVLDLLRDLNRTAGRTLIAVLHDLNQSFRYGDHLVVMKDGAIVAEGPPDLIGTADLIEDVFGIPCMVIEDPISGSPLVVPGGRDWPAPHRSGGSRQGPSPPRRQGGTQKMRSTPRHRTVRRTRVGLTAAALAVSLALTGCGGQEPPGERASATAGTIDFEYRDFSAVVPAEPQRVVVIEGRGDLEFALLAGYNVVGTRNSSSQKGELPGIQFEGLLNPDTTTVLSSGEVKPSYEEISALAPDLIVMRVNAWKADWYGNGRLQEIAPVLAVETNRPAFTRELTEQLKLLGREGRAADAVAKYEDAVARAKERLAGFIASGKQIVMLTTQNAANGSVLVWNNMVATQVAHDIGLKVMFRSADTEEQEKTTPLSTENLSDIAAADAVFYQTTDPSTTTALPTWQTLPAVRAGHAFRSPIEYNNGIVITGSSIADFLADSLESVG